VTCIDVRPWLDRYLDQALPAEEAAIVEAHINQCEECWAELNQWQAMTRDLAHPDLQAMVLANPPPLPADFTARLMERVEAERPPAFELLWPWLRKRWSTHQITSLAYGMVAAFSIFTMGNAYMAWNLSTNQMDIWMIQATAYSDSLQANMGGLMGYSASLVHALLQFSHLAQ
jgi:anti-sigma factor RsiW